MNYQEYAKAYGAKAARSAFGLSDHAVFIVTPGKYIEIICGRFHGSEPLCSHCQTITHTKQKLRNLVGKCYETSETIIKGEPLPETVTGVTAWVLMDHGIEYFQYFQGCGISYTIFENVVTGVGNNLAEAVDDCLEQVAMNGAMVDGLEEAICKAHGWSELPTTPCVEAEDNSYDEEAPCYHASIRYNEG